MVTDLLYKKGQAQKLANGTYVFVNGSNMQHPANGEYVRLWNLCNGISFEDLLSLISSDTNQSINVLQPSLQTKINKMIIKNLVEVKKVDQG